MDANRSSANAVRRVRMRRSCVGVTSCHRQRWRTPFGWVDIAPQVHPAPTLSQDLTEYCYPADPERTRVGGERRLGPQLEQGQQRVGARYWVTSCDLRI